VVFRYRRCCFCSRHARWSFRKLEVCCGGDSVAWCMLYGSRKEHSMAESIFADEVGQLRPLMVGYAKSVEYRQKLIVLADYRNNPEKINPPSSKLSSLRLNRQQFIMILVTRATYTVYRVVFGPYNYQYHLQLDILAK
jgi:hypothetical protein